MGLMNRKFIGVVVTALATVGFAAFAGTPMGGFEGNGSDSVNTADGKKVMRDIMEKTSLRRLKGNDAIRYLIETPDFLGLLRDIGNVTLFL